MKIRQSSHLEVPTYKDAKTVSTYKSRSIIILCSTYSLRQKPPQSFLVREEGKVEKRSSYMRHADLSDTGHVLSETATYQSRISKQNTDLTQRPQEEDGKSYPPACSSRLNKADSFVLIQSHNLEFMTSASVFLLFFLFGRSSIHLVPQHLTISPFIQRRPSWKH